MTTGILGDPQATLANILLGGTSSGLPDTVTFSVLVLDSKTLIAVFTTPMSDNAINFNNYTLLAIDSLSNTHQPPVASASFDGPSRTQVFIRFNDSLTFSRHYTLAASGIGNLAGDSECDSSYNFVMTVPDPPRALQAFLSGTNTLDVLYDRPVAPYSIGVTGTLQDAASSSHTTLTQVAYTAGAYPVNNIRFSFTATPTASSFVVNVGTVLDVSFNSSTPSVLPLSLVLRGTLPYTTATINTIQIVDGYVDHVSNDYLNRSYISVFFNGPVYPPDATNTANWTVMQSGAHVYQDTHDVVTASTPTDVSSLISICTALQAAYNSHIQYTNVHVIPDTALPSESDIIILANGLLQSYTAHASSSVYHSSSSAPNGLRPARTFETAISNLNSLRSLYNAHHSNSSLHVFADTAYAVFLPSAVDIRSATMLADELRIKFQMHFTSPYWHLIADTTDIPSGAYLFGPTVYETPSDLLTCAGALTELRDKYIQHINDGGVHLYPDDVNVITPSDLSLTRSQVIGADITTVGPVTASLRDVFNSHLAQNYSVPVFLVRNYTANSSSDAADPYPYMCLIETHGSSLIPTYTVQAAVRSNDLSTITNTMDHTGSIGAINGTAKPLRNLQSPPVLLSSQSLPEGKLLLRFDRELSVFPTMNYPVVSPMGTPPIAVASVGARASVQTLNILTNDVMRAYQLHLTLAGHIALDTIHVLFDGDFPQGDLSALISALNHFKSQFNYHASSANFHKYGTDFPIVVPDATDLASALILAHALRDSFLEHNGNLGLHSNSGPIVISAKGSDGILLDMKGIVDAQSYLVQVPVRDVVKDLSGTPPIHHASLAVPFSGVSPFPVLSAAMAQSGFQLNSDGHPQLNSDGVLLVFSRPMKRIPVDSSVVSFTGSITMHGASWLSDQALFIPVTGMGTGSYTVSVSGTTDTFGNSLVTNP